MQMESTVKPGMGAKVVESCAKDVFKPLMVKLMVSPGGIVDGVMTVRMGVFEGSPLLNPAVATKTAISARVTMRVGQNIEGAQPLVM